MKILPTLNKSILVALMLFGISALPFTAQAAPPTNAGKIQQQLNNPPTTPKAQPTTPAPLKSEKVKVKQSKKASPTIKLKKLLIVGNSVFDDAKLIKATDLPIGSKVTLLDLKAAAARITNYYREAGYLVARAYIPAQSVKNGAIRIAIQEGTLAGVHVDNKTNLSDNRVLKTLVHRIVVGKPLQSDSTNRDILLLQQTPGVGSVKAHLRPGKTSGSTYLDITAEKGPIIDGKLWASNYGNSYDGHYRFGAQVNLNNIAGIGDKMTISGTFSQALETSYGSFSWDAPIGYDGLRLGASYNHTHYNLSDVFSSLDAHGTADIYSAYGIYPVLLTPDTHVNLRFAYEHRRLKDYMLGSAIDTKWVDAMVLSLNGDFRDNVLGTNAVTAWRVSNTVGYLQLDSLSESIDKSTGADTRGLYDKVNISISRDQQLPIKNLSFYTAARGQLAAGNLDSSEKLFLGGPYGLRGFPRGEAGGDLGWLVTFALHYKVMRQLQLRGFYDFGGVTFNRHAFAGGPNHRQLADVGVGMTANWKSFTFSLDAAWATKGKAVSDANRMPRVWGKLVWRF